MTATAFGSLAASAMDDCPAPFDEADCYYDLNDGYNYQICDIEEDDKLLCSPGNHPVLDSDDPGHIGEQGSHWPSEMWAIVDGDKAIVWAEMDYGQGGPSPTETTELFCCIFDADDISRLVIGSQSEDDIIHLVHHSPIYGRLSWFDDPTGRVTTSAGDDVVYASDNDFGSIRTGDDNDIVYGSSNDDTVYGGDGADIIYGYGGDDVLVGEGGMDWIHGGTGFDELYGDGGSDVLCGWKEWPIDRVDTMDGGALMDYCYGGWNDTSTSCIFSNSACPNP